MIMENDKPVDAWSSLAPALVASILLASALGGRSALGSPLARSRGPTLLLAAAAGSIAIFSFHYHATHTWLGEWLDGVSLYFLAGYAIAWAATRTVSCGSTGIFTAIYLGVAAVPALLAALVPEARKPAFVVLAVVAIVVELLSRRRVSARGNPAWLALAIGSFVAAGVAWTLDWTRTVCYPESWFQLHAVWHLLSAPTILALHAHFASEREVALPPPTGR